MTDWIEQVETALNAFLTVAALSGHPINRDEFEVEFLSAPHRPPTRLPDNKVAVYGFWGDGSWLKIGKAGPNSHARYSSQHYCPGSARSTLAGSLLKDHHMRTVGTFSLDAPGTYVKAETSRFNILMEAQRHGELLPLLEAFLHLRLKPRYEG